MYTCTQWHYWNQFAKEIHNHRANTLAEYALTSVTVLLWVAMSKQKQMVCEIDLCCVILYESLIYCKLKIKVFTLGVS